MMPLRTLNRLYAKTHGYFWGPCPLCGQDFGGHEEFGFIPTDRECVSEGICASCTALRQRHAEEELARRGGRVVVSANGVRHTIPHQP